MRNFQRISIFVLAYLSVAETAWTETVVSDNVDEVQVLMAVNDVELNQFIQRDDVVLKSFHPDQVPEGVAKSLEDIADKKTRSRVNKGNFVLLANLTDENQAPDCPLIPKGYRVFSIPLAPESKFCNILRPGVRIDCIAVYRQPKTNQQIARTFLKNICVFAVDQQRAGEKELKKIVQVLVLPRQAEQLTLVQSLGSLHIGLRTGPETADKHHKK